MRRQITYDPDQDYYDILGIEASADSDVLREAYRRAVRAVHPDLNPDRQDWATEQLQRVNEAYDVLSDYARRRLYDQARWPHVPVGGRRSSHAKGSSTSYSPPPYDPNRPWWEQARPAHRTRRTGQPAASPLYRSHRRRTPPSDPVWLMISNWLKKRGWQRLNTLWLTLVGLWRSPYAMLLTVLAIILAADVALIVYVAATPYRWEDVQAWFDDQTERHTATPNIPKPTTIALADELNLTCADPDLRITSPIMGDPVPDSFHIYGTLHNSGLWTYRIAVGYVGETASTGAVPTQWSVVRQSPTNQSIPERAVDNGLLTDTPISLADHPAGFYALRLEVELRNGDILRPCDIVVRR